MLERLVSAVESWTEPPQHIRVGRPLSGGRTEADVFEIIAEFASGQWQYVVKIGPAEEMAAEWKAREHFRDRPNILCAPIQFATDGAREPRGEGWDREAIVYGHVKSFSGTPGAPLRTLEEVVGDGRREGGDAVDRAVHAIGMFGERARTVFYKQSSLRAEASSLRELAPSLGLCSTLEVDRVDERGRLVAGSPSARDLRERYLGPTALLKASLDPDLDAPLGGALNLGRVRLNEEGVATTAPGQVRVQIVPAADSGLKLADLDRPVTVYGRVTSRYAEARWSMIRAKCPELEREGLDVVCGGERTYLPFARLLSMLTAEEAGRVVSLGHGDANPRNILLSGDLPFMIDFARTKQDLPLASDFCWLELGLLRDVFAEHLDFGRLLLLQRALALASRAVHLSGDRTEAAFVPVLDRTAPELVTAFRVLWAVRTQAWRAHPDYAGPPWWRDYLAHLTISANRMLKWSPDDHTDSAVRATVAAAGAATEAWGDPDPYRRWRTDLLVEITRNLARCPDPGRPDTAETLAGLVRELDAREVDDPGLEEVLATVRDDLVRAVFGKTAAWTVARERERHDDYLALAAYPLEDGDPPGEDVQDLLAREPHVALMGMPAGGKSSVLLERRYRLAAAAARTGDSGLRIPLSLNASRLVASPETDVLDEAWRSSGLPDGWREQLPALITLGAVCLLADDLHRLAGDERARVCDGLSRLARGNRRGSMVVCHRRSYTVLGPPDAVESEPFRVLVLAAPGAEQLRRHLAVVLSGRGVPHHVEKAGLVIERLRSHHEDSVLPPVGLLLPLARRADPDVLMAGEVYAEYVRNLSKDRQAILGTIAEVLTELRIDRIAISEWPGHHHELIDGLVADGLLERDPVPSPDPKFGFALPVLREYFAALWLSRLGTIDLMDASRLVTDFHWHEPIRLLLTFHTGEPVPTLLSAALEHDPVLAVTFLRASRLSADDMRPHLREIVQTGLLSAGAPAGERRMALALADLNVQEVRDLLRAVVAEPDVPISSRVAALHALERMTRRGSGPARARSRRTLRHAVSDALRDGVPDEVQAAALGTARSTGMHNPLLRIAELVDASRPWPVTRAAMQLLRAQDIDLTEDVRRRWIASCERRLEGNQRELHGPLPFAEQFWLVEEWRGLLDEMAEAGRRDVMLAHRFRFGVEEHVESLLDLPEPDSVEITSVEITADAPPRRLLAAAVAVPELDAVRDAARLDEIEAVVGRLAARADGHDALEPLAALVNAVFAIDRPRGIRMALATARTLEEREVQARRAWPWTDVFARARGGPSDLMALLDDGDADLAIYGLSLFGFLVDAEPGPEDRPSRKGRERLLARRPDPPQWRYVIAAATAGLSEARDDASRLALSPGFGTEPYPLGTGRYGEIEDTELAGVLAAAGYLGRLSRLRGDLTSEQLALMVLRDFPVQGQHPSVATGRLAGLAYLGEWREVLRGCTRDEPRLRRIAANAVLRWSPSDQALQVAQWIDEHLRHAELPEGVRLLLGELQRDREHEAGFYARGT